MVPKSHVGLARWCRELALLPGRKFTVDVTPINENYETQLEGRYMWQSDPVVKTTSQSVRDSS